MASLSGPPARPPFWNLSAWRAMYPGMWAWVIQRLSAVVLLVIFPFHVLNPYNKWLRIAVLALVILHGMHGLKVIFTDFGFPARHQRKLLWVLTALGAAAFFWLAYLRKAFWGFF
ncbi:MAG: hypothetical protein QF701_16555 [Nitrospinota bacterium]|nr:hypothetical protein [Nitrospinota bacterium]MDP6364612.1 hypothetical protein [Nitrospinota bacterium]MDP7169338.1 hypothetical protein [Nitrospinota bacterium]MDP7369397.1 hypothetical protein [Nitrospinota bacterium]MDP7502822.1 hypothetical protein [Nitrospinota bacterium]